MALGARGLRAAHHRGVILSADTAAPGGRGGAARAGGAALAERLRQVPAGVMAEQIATLRPPTLILGGERDRLIPPEHAEMFHRRIAGSQVVMFPALGHVPHEEDPVATAAAVKKFLGAP